MTFKMTHIICGHLQLSVWRSLLSTVGQDRKCERRERRRDEKGRHRGVREEDEEKGSGERRRINSVA